MVFIAPTQEEHKAIVLRLTQLCLVSLRAKVSAQGFSYGAAQRAFDAVAGITAQHILKLNDPKLLTANISPGQIKAAMQQYKLNSSDFRVGLMMTTLATFFTAGLNPVTESGFKNIFRENPEKAKTAIPVMIEKFAEFATIDQAEVIADVSQFRAAIFVKARRIDFPVENTVNPDFLEAVFRSAENQFKSRASLTSFMDSTVKATFQVTADKIHERLNQLQIAAELTDQERALVKIKFFGPHLEAQREMIRIGEFAARLLASVLHNS